MQVEALDHVNIVTDDLEATVRFYEAVLGLTRGESLGARMGIPGAWMHDPGGKAVIHLAVRQADGGFGADIVPGTSTGAIHHVAFRCSGFEDAKARIEQAGYPYRASTIEKLGISQIFVLDPNNVQVEMNFPGS